MDNKTPKLKKKVSFGKAKVRLVFDYYNQDCMESTDTDEKSSKEVVIPSQSQKPSKSILKRPSNRAISVDSGLDELQRVPRRRFEWEQMDRNFWEPGKYKSRGKKGQDFQEDKDSKSTSDSLVEDGKTGLKQENSSFSKDELDMASSELEIEQKKPRVKNNEKWSGITSSYAEGMASSKFVGIYSGVEADWDQTKQSLARIGIDIGENSLQNPREFVAIMNMLLSKEKMENQNVREQENTTEIERSTELRDENDNCIRGEEQKTIPWDEKDPVIKEEMTSTKLDTTHKKEKPAISKKELKKRIKKLKIKGLIPGKKNNSGKISKEKSYSEDNLNYLPRTDVKVKNYEKHSSFEKENCEKEKRSDSESSLDYFSKFEVRRTSKRDEGRSMEELNFDTDPECSSTDSSSTINQDHSYSDNNLDLPKRLSLASSLKRNLLRERSSSCRTEGGHPEQDLKHKSERRTVVKRDSWFLSRKPKLREEKSNLDEEQKYVERNDQRECIDQETQFRQDISQRKSSSKISGDTIKKKSSVEVQENSKSGSKLEKQSNNEKNESKPSPKLDKKLKPKDEQSRKRGDGNFCKIQIKNGQRERNLDQVNDDSASVSQLDHNNKSLKPKDPKKTEAHKESRTTLLSIVNQSESEREDSGLSSSTSYDTNKERASNVVQKNSEKNIPVEEPKLVSDDVSECCAITEEPNTTNTPETKELKEVKQVEKTTRVDVEITAPQPKESVKAEHEETSKSIENKENFTCKNEMHTKIDENEDLINKTFQNDIQFIDWETKRSLRSEQYLERARKRYRPKSNKQNIALVVMGAISKNPAAGVMLPFSN